MRLDHLLSKEHTTSLVSAGMCSAAGVCSRVKHQTHLGCRLLWSVVWVGASGDRRVAPIHYRGSEGTHVSSGLMMRVRSVMGTVVVSGGGPVVGVCCLRSA